MTIHQAKGLEFPVVFLPSQNERNTKKSIIDSFNELLGYSSSTEEERRIFYVGATRAEDLLIISYSQKLKRAAKDYTATKYLDELLRHESCTNICDYDLLKEQKFKEKETKNYDDLVLSYNKINLYLICPLAYKYANVWMLQTVRIGGLEFGRNIHKIIEIILKKIKNGEKIKSVDIDELLENNWRDDNFRSDSENKKYKEAAIKQIKTFVEGQKELLLTDNIFSIEDEFNVQIENNLITGRFDAVFQKDSEFTIVDFKTGDERDYTTQLSFYHLCFKEKYRKEKIKLAVYLLKKGELKKIEPTNIQDEIDIIRKVAINIKKRIYKPTAGKHCLDCAYNTICEFAYKK